NTQNVRSPHDLGIVAFDDHPWAAVSCPPITVVRQPTHQIGQMAAEMILSLIENRPVPEKRIVLPCELVVRQSCRAKKLELGYDHG
ncbi:MAG: substrate-binding domain-containing protein, partial [Caldilinea sp.]